MHRLFFAPVCLATILFARGTGVEIPITPGNLEHPPYSFSVSTNTAHGGIAFHVTVKATTQDIPSDWCTAGLMIVTHKKEPGGGVSGSIGPLEPAIRVTLKKDKRIWQAAFIISHELLKQPGLCFVFSERAHSTANGKNVAEPGADFYEMKLKDFIQWPE